VVTKQSRLAPVDEATGFADAPRLVKMVERKDRLSSIGARPRVDRSAKPLAVTDARRGKEIAMANDRVDRTVVTQGPTVAAGQETVQTDSRRISSVGPGASELTRRVIVLVFGLIQVVIAARFVLLLLDAREANGLVSGVLNVSQLFVAPFDGILRTDSLHAAGSVLDITAIVAFVGWTIIELIVIWAVGIFRREPA
jgi:hypothetical protein